MFELSTIEVFRYYQLRSKLLCKRTRISLFRFVINIYEKQGFRMKEKEVKKLTRYQDM